MKDLSNFVKRIRDIMRNDAGINGDAQRIEQIAWMLFLKVYDEKVKNWEIDADENDNVFESIIPKDYRWNTWAHEEKQGAVETGDKLLEFVNNKLFPTLKNLNITPETSIKNSIVKAVFEDANNYMKDGFLLRQVINIIDGLDFSNYEEIHAVGEIYESILKELQSAGSAGEFYTPRAVTDFITEMIKPKIGEKMADFACGTGGFIASWLKKLPERKTTQDIIAVNNSVYGMEKKQFPYMLCVTNMLLHGLDEPRIYHDNSLTFKRLDDYTDTEEGDQFDVILMNPPYGGNEKKETKDYFPDDLASSETADLFMSLIMCRLKEDGRAAIILPDGFLFGTDSAKVNIKKNLFHDFNLHTVIRMPHSVFSPYTSITTNILFFDKTGPTKETWFYRLDMPDGYKNFSKTRPMLSEHFDPVKEWWNNRKEITADGFDKAKKYSADYIAKQNFNIDLCGYPHEEEEILSPAELILQYREKRKSIESGIDKILLALSDKLSNNTEGGQ